MHDRAISSARTCRIAPLPPAYYLPREPSSTLRDTRRRATGTRPRAASSRTRRHAAAVGRFCASAPLPAIRGSEDPRHTFNLYLAAHCVVGSLRAKGATSRRRERATMKTQGCLIAAAVQSSRWRPARAPSSGRRGRFASWGAGHPRFGWVRVPRAQRSRSIDFLVRGQPDGAGAYDA